MLSVIYVLYHLFSRYFYGPPPAEDEEVTEEKRVLKTETEQSTEELEGQSSIKKVKAKTLEVVEKEAYFDHCNNDLVNPVEAKYSDVDEESAVTVNVGVKPIDYSQLYEDEDVEKSAPMPYHSAPEPHFVILEDDSEDDDIVSSFGVVSVTSKFKIKEPLKKERTPFTQTIWGTPEPEEVEYAEIGPEGVYENNAAKPEGAVGLDEVEPQEIEAEEVESEDTITGENSVDYNADDIVVEATTVELVSCEPSSDLSQIQQEVIQPVESAYHEMQTPPKRKLESPEEAPSPKRKLEEVPSPQKISVSKTVWVPPHPEDLEPFSKRRLESQKSLEISDFDKKMSKESYLELSMEQNGANSEGANMQNEVSLEESSMRNGASSEEASMQNEASSEGFCMQNEASLEGVCVQNGASACSDVTLSADIVEDNSVSLSAFGNSASVASSYVKSYNREKANGILTPTGPVNGSHNSTHENGAAADQDDPFTEPKKPEIRKYLPKPKVYEVKSDAEWNTFFETSMLTGRREAILDGLKECFKTASHPYMLCCDLLITFGITHASGRSIFQRAALKQLTVWRTRSDLKPCLSDQLKALEVSYLCNHTHFVSLFAVFDLEETSTEEAVAFIRDKLEHKKKKYIKHMAFLVTELNLQAQFDTAEMLFPLLAMDKMMTIEAYLNTIQLQTEFIRHLDDLLSPSTDKLHTLINILSTEFDFDETSSQFQFTSDQITTLVKRFLKKYKVSPESAPNLSESKTISNLKNLLFCKYKKGSKEDWTQAITDAVRNSEMLQASLLSELVRYNDLPYAATIVESLQIKPFLIPAKIQSYIDTHQLKSAPLPPDTYVFDKPDVSWTEITDEKENKAPEVKQEVQDVKMAELVQPVPDLGYLSLPSTVQIVDVANAAELQQCSKLLSVCSVIGLDSEWRAVLDPTQCTPVALLQLACNQCVFLLDVPALQANVTEKELGLFAREVFGHSTVVGYGLEGDVLKLNQTVPALGDVLSTSCMVDLATAHKHIVREENEVRSAGIREAISQGLPLPPRAAVQYTGLAKLCESVLSAPLDKTCQISDWVRRPLTASQRQYAALDAYVVLYLYDKLTARFLPVPLADLPDVPQSSGNTDGNSELYEAPKNESPVDSNSLKVVVDIPLQGLGKKLRHIGVNCVILASGQDLDHAAKVSLMEGRVILSKDSNAERLAKLTDPGRVYSVTSKDATTQLAEIIKHFNLTVNDSDLFSRCAMCNCADFVKITTEQAGQIKALTETANSSTVEFSAPVYRRRVEAVSNVKISMVGVTQYGVKMQLNKVKNKKLYEVNEFWGCYDCGKMYWDGCHLRNFKDKHDL